MKTQTRGNCQCCGRDQAVLASGLMSKHGYTVDHGWFNGVCQGQNHRPLQQDRAATTAMVNQIHEDVVEAYNQHAALVAVAEAARCPHKTHDVPFSCGDCEVCKALAALAAVRAGQPVAAVKYGEAVFNTKEDADCWISQERSKAGFHVVEAGKAAGGFKVVFERRNGGVK